MHKRDRPSAGFTIVELLIVIVVIAILAAISTIAYRGIQERARASEVSSALTQAKTKLELYKVDNGTYPASGNLASAGVTSSNGSFQYTSDGSTFCLTATSGSVSYTATNTTNPTQGGCAGHGQGGVAAVTNLVTNPSFETDTTGWGENSGQSLTVTSSWSGSGSSSALVQRSSGSSATTFNFRNNSTGAIPVQPGQPYSARATVRAEGGPLNMRMQLRWDNTTTGQAIGALNSVGSTAQDLTATGTAPSGVSTVYVWISASGVSSNSQQVFIDSVMVTVGSQIYTYADGNSSNWIWNGTPNNSTSTGPAL